MNLKSAQSLSKCHRPGNPALQDPQVQKAARMIEATPDLKAGLAAQVEFDDRQAKILDSIKPDAAFLDKIDGTVENLQKGFQWSALRQPPFSGGSDCRDCDDRRPRLRLARHGGNFPRP